MSTDSGNGSVGTSGLDSDEESQCDSHEENSDKRMMQLAVTTAEIQKSMLISARSNETPRSSGYYAVFLTQRA